MAIKDDPNSTLKEIDELIKLYTKDFGANKDVEALEEAKRKLVDSGPIVVKEVNKIVDKIKRRNNDLLQKLEYYISDTDDEGVTGAAESTKGFIKRIFSNQFSSAKNFMENISSALSPESISKLTGGKGIADTLKDTGTAVALSNLAKGFEVAAGKEEQLSGHLQEYRKLAMEVSDINIFTAFEGEKKEDFIKKRSEAIKTLRNDVVALQNAIPGISAEAARTAIASISQQSKTLSQIIQNAGTDGTKDAFGGFSGFDDGDRDVRKRFMVPGTEGGMSGSAALMATIKGLGLETNKTLPLIDKMMTELGTQTSDILPRLTAFGIAARGSGLATDEFVESVGTMAGQFAFLGDQTVAVSAGLKNFLQGFQNTGQIKLAKQTYEALTKSVADMGDEMKAFLSISTGLGGGAGAIPGIVDLEEALASGDQSKINEVIKAAMSQVEQMSGGPLLTRKEAVQTGQQERYFIQAELAKQLLPNIANRGMFDIAVKGMRQGETLTPAILEAQSRSSENLGSIIDTGVAAQQASLSFSEMSANALVTLRDNLLGPGFGVYLKATDTMQKAVSDALPGLAGKDFTEISKLFMGMAEKPSPDGGPSVSGSEGAAVMDFSAGATSPLDTQSALDFALKAKLSAPTMDIARLSSGSAPGAAFFDSAAAASTSNTLSVPVLETLFQFIRSTTDESRQLTNMTAPPQIIPALINLGLEPLQLTIGIDLDPAAQGLFKLKQTSSNVLAVVKAVTGQP